MTDVVSCAVADGVAHLELNRPESANALDLPLATALRARVRDIAEDPAVSVVLLSGAGRRFCAGGDITSFLASDDSASYLRHLAEEMDHALQSLAAMAKPVVAAVHGAVAGAGLAVMLSCDLIVADPSTKFAFAYPGIGLTPDCGLSYLLPRAVGSHRALAFALGGQVWNAQQALQAGLVTEVDGAPLGRARDLAASLAAGPSAALGQSRRLLRQGWELDRASTGAEEARTISEMVAGDEARTLINRFLES